MRLFKTKRKVECNMCGKKMDKLEGLKFEFRGVYGSKYDGNTIKFHLCAGCLDDMIDNYLMKYSAKKPEITDCFEWYKKVPAYYR